MMRNDNEDKYKDLPDEFSELVRLKLERHKVVVDKDCWSGIESRLNPMIARKKNIKRWITSVAAAAAFIGIVVLLLPDKQSISEMASVMQQSEYTFPEKLLPKSNNGLAMSEPHEKQPEKLRTAILPIPENNAKKTEVSVTGDKQDKTDILPPTSETDTPSADNQKENRTDPQAQNKTASKKESTEANVHDYGKILLPKKKNNNNWTLAASMYSNGNMISQNGLERLKSDFQSSEGITNGEDDEIILRDPGDSNTKFLSSRDFPEMEHDIPLSFGFTVRKDFTKHLAVETGLTYTYLSTTFKRTNIPQYQAKQELHYLGVPVNVVAYILNDPKWNIYVSAGGMVEKGLTRKYTQEMYQTDDKTSAISEKGSISGLQWSLNASVGIGYNFYKGIGVYVEPRFSHYFENNQPISIRTDKKSVFGLGAGIRYKFK